METIKVEDINNVLSSVLAIRYQENSYQQLPKNIENFEREQSIISGDWQRGVYTNKEKDVFIVVDVFIDEDKLEIEMIKILNDEKEIYNLKALVVVRDRKVIPNDLLEDTDNIDFN